MEYYDDFKIEQGVGHFIEHISDINAVDDSGETALYEAVRHGDHEYLKALINKGANPSLCDKYRRTPLHIAAVYGHHECLQALIEIGAILDLADNRDRTPLYIAAENGHHECLQTLIDNGANLDLTDTHGRTPLYVAAQNGHHECLQTLVEKGADITIASNDNETPKAIALKKRHNDIVDILTAAEKSLKQKNNSPQESANDKSELSQSLEVNSNYAITADGLKTEDKKALDNLTSKILVAPMQNKVTL